MPSDQQEEPPAKTKKRRPPAWVMGGFAGILFWTLALVAHPTLRFLELRHDFFARLLPEWLMRMGWFGLDIDHLQEYVEYISSPISGNWLESDMLLGLCLHTLIGAALVTRSNAHLRMDALELARWTRIAGFATPTSLMQRAIPRLLELSYDQSWLNDWRASVTVRLQQAGYGVVPSDATLFVYVETPGRCGDWEFTAELARRGVLVLPAPVFHHGGHFRLALTGSKDMLLRALDVMEEVGSRCAA
jgi:hypothetical protein